MPGQSYWRSNDGTGKPLPQNPAGASGGRDLEAFHVNVAGQEAVVTPPPGLTLGAIATQARWLVGYGSVPFDNWEIRDENGTLLDPYAPPGNIRRLFINRLAGIGA